MGKIGRTVRAEGVEKYRELSGVLNFGNWTDSSIKVKIEVESSRGNWNMKAHKFESYD